MRATLTRCSLLIWFISLWNPSTALRLSVTLPPCSSLRGAVLPAQSTSVDVPVGTTVRLLKARLNEKLLTAVPIEYQNILLNGTVLDDSIILDDIVSGENVPLTLASPLEARPIDNADVAKLTSREKTELLIKYVKLLAVLHVALDENESDRTLGGEDLQTRLQTFFTASATEGAVYQPTEARCVSAGNLPRTLVGRLDRLGHYYCNINYKETTKHAALLILLMGIADRSNRDRMRLLLQYGIPGLLFVQFRPIKKAQLFLLKAIFGVGVPDLVTNLLPVGQQEVLLYTPTKYGE